MAFVSWILPALLAALIAWLSHQPQLPFGVGLPHPLDKLAHAAAYATLAWLVDHAFRRSRSDLPVHRRHSLTFLIVLAFGVLDEWHQAHIPGREASWADLGADGLGGLVGLGLASLPFLRGRRALPDFSWWRGERRRPDPTRPLILVADPHWGEELTGLRELTLAHPDADWLFLGDVFDVWVGLRGMAQASQRAFLWWVRDRRAAGRWVGLWMGNREYFLDGLSGHFALIGEGVGGCLPEERLAWEHGDLINGQDRAYRLWNLVSRSGFLWAVAGILPSSAAQALALRLERALRTTNREYKLAFPREAFRAAVAEWGGDWTFVTGHFHIHEQEGRGTALPWAHEGQAWVWREGRLDPLPLPERAR